MRVWEQEADLPWEFASGLPGTGVLEAAPSTGLPSTGFPSAETIPTAEISWEGNAAGAEEFEPVQETETRESFEAELGWGRGGVEWSARGSVPGEGAESSDEAAGDVGKSGRVEPAVRVTKPGEPEPLRQLRARLEHFEARRGGRRGPAVSSGFPLLDARLPEGGLPRGCLVEWLTPGPGSGTLPLALQMARQACDEGQWWVLSDRAGVLYPPALEAWGIDLKRVIWVRPATRDDELWALDQALRCPGVGAAWCRLGQLDERWLRRLQLAAEAGGTLGLFERPASVLGQPAWSDLQILVEPQPIAAGPGGSKPGVSMPVSRSGAPRSQQATSQATSHAPLAQAGARGAPSPAPPTTRADWAWRLEVVRGRGAALGWEWQVMLEAETGQCRELAGPEWGEETPRVETYRTGGGERDGKAASLSLRLVSQLAHPTPRRRSARA